MSAGRRPGLGGDGPGGGERPPRGAPPGRRTPRLGSLDPLRTGTRGFPAPPGKGQLESGVRGVRAERGEELVLLWVVDPLGGGSIPSGSVGWHGQWEESEVGVCFVGRNPALCEMK